MPSRTSAQFEGPPQGEMIQLFRVQVPTCSCGGPVRTSGINVCVRDIHDCTIDNHSTKLKVDRTFGIDPKLPLVMGYYLQTVGAVTAVYSELFLPAALSESSQVFLAQLEEEIPKDITMAIMEEIKAMAEGPDPFVLEDEEDEDPLNATTAQQYIVNNLAVRGTPTSAKKMQTKVPVDVNVFQDAAIDTFAAGMDHNLEEAAHMFQSLQVDHRITDTAVGTAPE